MWQWLKRLFRKESQEIEKVALKELPKWFSNKYALNLLILDKRLFSLLQRINEEIAAAKQNVIALKDAKLQNDNIPEKAKYVMEGNRASYLRKTEWFLKSFSGLEIKQEKNDYENIRKFFGIFYKELEEFTRATTKPYQVLQHFFAHESRDIALNIKNFEGMIREIAALIDNAKLDEKDDIESSIALLEKRLSLKEMNKRWLDEKNSLLKKLENELEGAKDNVSLLLNSKEHRILNELKANKEALAAKMREHNSKITHVFAVLERALKKYAKISFEHEALINAYLADAISALKEDKELIIIKVLEKVKELVANDTLDIKDKKKEKTLEELGNAGKEVLENFKKTVHELNAELKQFSREIEDNKFSQDIKDAEEKRNNTETRVRSLQREIEIIKKELSEEHLKDFKEKLEKQIEGYLRTQIKIII